MAGLTLFPTRRRSATAAVEASQKGETLIQEAEEKASRDVAEAQTQLRRCVEMASQRMLAARQSVQDAKKSTGEKIERHLDAAQAADEQVLEAMEEEKTSEERAQKLVAAARRDAPGSDALVKRFEAEQQRCQVLKRCQVIEKQLAEDLKELKEGNAQKVLAAVRASEAAVRRSKELVEAAKVDMDKHQKEMLQKREEADAKVTKMDQKAQATGLWSQEVHSKFNRLLLEAKKKLSEQQELTQQERHLQEERAKERMDTMTQRLQETEILATITEEDCDRRTVAARSEAEVAAQAATQRRAWAVEAEEAAARMAQIEMDATQREAEETCQSLQRQRDEMQKVCQQQQQEAVDNVSEARSAVEHAMASAQSRLASIQSCAASAARELQRCQAEELQIAEELEEREIDFITRVQDLEKAEMQKTCTISHCQELVVVAEQSAWRSLQQHQDAAKEKVTEEDNRAQSAEEIAEMLEGQALCAEEVACSEELKQKQQLQREHQRLCESVQEASNRTVNVQDAIHEAVHYSQKSIDELYRYLKSVGGQNSQATPSPMLPKGLDKGCPKCNVMYTPSSNFCQHCGKKLELQQPTGTPTPLGSRSPRIRKICSRSYGRVRKSRTVSTSPSAAGGNVKRAA